MNDRERTSQGYTYNSRNATFEYRQNAGTPAPYRQTQRPTGQQPSQQRSAQRPTGAPARNVPPSTKKKKKKLRFKPNKEGMIALIALVLVVALIITFLVLTIKAIVGAIVGDDTETSSSTDTSDSGIQIPAKTWHDGYLNLSYSNAKIEEGDLILVNFENKYAHTENISKNLRTLYDRNIGYSSTYVLNTIEAKVHRDIRTSLSKMMADFVAENPETLGSASSLPIIVSGYRNTETQQKKYDNRKPEDEGLIAQPGHSEHHTGYAVDIQIFTAERDIREMNEDEQAWLEANCAEYGFILRYDGTKYDITGILDEPWHFRYVGVPHATYMTENGLCLEEYLELLRKNYNYETTDAPLTFTVGDAEYSVYYVEASADSTTFIPIPPSSDGEYSVSGDNMNGFIVTVEKAAKTNTDASSSQTSASSSDNN